MDELFIQEQVIIKTEKNEEDDIDYVPLSDSLDSRNVESFFLDTSNNHELMVGLFLQNDDDNYLLNPPLPPVLESPPNRHTNCDDKLRKSNSEESLMKFKQNKKISYSNIAGHIYKMEKSENELDDLGFDQKLVTLECSLCMYETNKSEELKFHMMEHIAGPDLDTFIEESLKGKMFACIFCPFTSVGREIFKDHVKRNHSTSKSKKSKVKIKKDKIDNEKKPIILKCTYCTSTFSDRYQRKKHMEADHGKLLYECNFCSYSSQDKQNLKNHTCINGVYKPKQYGCFDCDYSTDSEDSFSRHTAEHSIESARAILENTSKSYSEVKRRRKKTVPRKESDSSRTVHHCPYCNFSNTQKSAVMRHERIHTGIKPFTCPHCPFSCTQNAYLRIHVRLHTGDKPYQCSRCPFRTVSRCLLNVHQKKHSNRKVLQCVKCCQIFDTEMALSRHRKTYENSFDCYGTITTRKPRRRRRNVTPEFKEESKIKKIKTFIPVKDRPIVDKSVRRYYQCSFCPFKSTKFSKLTEHTQSIHHDECSQEVNSDQADESLEVKDLAIEPLKGGEDKYSCIICNVMMNRKKDLRAHIKECHSDELSKKDGMEVEVGEYVLNVLDDI